MAYKLKELNFADLTVGLFKDFNRDQEVKKCWRRENGEWILKDVVFTEKWNAANYRFLTECLQNTIKSGGTVYGAFDQEKLFGFASLENVFIGSRKQYLQLSSIHVSCEYRGGVDHARERLEHENRKLKETIGELTVELKKNDW